MRSAFEWLERFVGYLDGDVVGLHRRIGLVAHDVTDAAKEREQALRA
jgi:hypothetical protein